MDFALKVGTKARVDFKYTSMENKLNNELFYHVSELESLIDMQLIARTLPCLLLFNGKGIN